MWPLTRTCLPVLAAFLSHHNVHASEPISCSVKDGCNQGNAMLQMKKGLTEIVAKEIREPCEFLDSFNRAEDSFEIPQDENDPLLKLPDGVSQAVFGGAPDLIAWLNTQIRVWQESSSRRLAVGEGIVDGCEELNILRDEDVVSVGYHQDPKKFCLVANPCKHSYGFSQDNLLPPIRLGEYGTVEINLVAISGTKRLSTGSHNPMWEGRGMPQSQVLFGHWYMRGNFHIILPVDLYLPSGLKLKTGITLRAEVEPAISLCDMDPAGDGPFPPLAEGEYPQPDFALMLQGLIEPVIGLPGNFELDLGGLIKTQADLLININSKGEKKFLYGARLIASMTEICDIAPALLGLLCKIFKGDSDGELTGPFYMFANREFGFGARMELEGILHVQNDFVEDFVKFPDGISASVGFELAFIDATPNICVQWNLQEKCFGSCGTDTDCGAEDFCDSVFKVCRKKQNPGMICTKDEACKSDSCNNHICLASQECVEQVDCTEKDPNLYCTGSLSLTPNTCVAKNPDGWKVCLNNHQCASGHCSSLGICRECLEDSHCSKGSYCTSGSPASSAHTCANKKGKNERCTKSKECASNRCSWRFKCT